MKEVTQKVSGAGRVTVALATPNAEATGIAQGVDFVTHVEQSDNTLLVTMPDTPDKMAALNRSLVEAGVDVAGLSVQEHNLETVFMQISRREEESHVA